MAGTDTHVVPQPQRERTSSRTRPRSAVVLSAFIAVQGGALAVLAGLDGSPGWRAARALVVVTMAVLAAWFIPRAGRTARGAAVLVLGTIGTAAGGGVASAHLAKAGLDTAAVLAAVVLVAGVV